jgi:hypothetical protein
MPEDRFSQPTTTTTQAPTTTTTTTQTSTTTTTQASITTTTQSSTTTTATETSASTSVAPPTEKPKGDDRTGVAIGVGVGAAALLGVLVYFLCSRSRGRYAVDAERGADGTGNEKPGDGGSGYDRYKTAEHYGTPTNGTPTNGTPTVKKTSGGWVSAQQDNVNNGQLGQTTVSTYINITDALKDFEAALQSGILAIDIASPEVVIANQFKSILASDKNNRFQNFSSNLSEEEEIILMTKNSQFLFEYHKTIIVPHFDAKSGKFLNYEFEYIGKEGDKGKFPPISSGQGLGSQMNMMLNVFAAGYNIIFDPKVDEKGRFNLRIDEVENFESDIRKASEIKVQQELAAWERYLEVMENEYDLVMIQDQDENTGEVSYHWEKNQYHDAVDIEGEEFYDAKTGYIEFKPIEGVAEIAAQIEKDKGARAIVAKNLLDAVKMLSVFHERGLVLNENGKFESKDNTPSKSCSAYEVAQLQQNNQHSISAY